ncbi:MAG TPA: TorF family putative porin [Albitalea sp.]|nr:TorF family putative porin [Albitalea sp.]
MKTSLWALAAITAVTAMPVVVHAEDANPLSFNVSLTSDYRYRGISQSRLKPALQGGADYALPNGFYVGTWGSTISWIKDAGKLAGVDTGSAPVEIDLYGGYKGEIQKGLGYDVGLLQYWYPGNHLANIAKNANTLEIYGALSYGIFTAKYSYAVTTLFGTPDSKGSGYLDLSAGIDAGNGFTVTPHIGRQEVRHWSNGSYTDYSLTLAKDAAGFTWSGAIVGTDAKHDPNGVFAYPSPDLKNLGRNGIVLAVKKTF